MSSRNTGGLRRWLASFLVAAVVGAILGLTADFFTITHYVASNGEFPTPLPTPSPEFTPSRSFNAQMDEELRRAWKELKEGRIAYAPKLVMKQGKAEEVVVRITNDPHTNLVEGLTGKVWIDRLQTSGSMAAYLEGKQDEFDIVALTSARQALAGTSSDWVWKVTPLKSGELSLNLRVVAIIRLSQGLADEKDVIVKRKKIIVEVDRVWVADQFIDSNWQWLLGSPVLLGGGAWLVARFRRKDKERKVGFE